MRRSVSALLGRPLLRRGSPVSSLGDSWADEPLSLPYETVLAGGPGGRGWIALGTGLSEGYSGRLRMSVGPVSRGNGVGCGGCAGCWTILRKAVLHELSERPFAGGQR